jgi:hypothetical protein
MKSHNAPKCESPFMERYENAGNALFKGFRHIKCTDFDRAL